MESELLLSWKNERAELASEISRLQDELAGSRAVNEELRFRGQALSNRVRGPATPFCFTFPAGWSVTVLLSKLRALGCLSSAGSVCRAVPLHVDTLGHRAAGVEEEADGESRAGVPADIAGPQAAEQGQHLGIQ